ncbi:MAG: SRPBCC domain-containing protein [Candidatus Tectomicrobia bacterium]|uniref:SRPBCC domain-containing protein n=1 Tax=Tectimicrobiota bacterium TaxID=2528274 RepID=A0A932MLC5_UNCTE|nr:SRPBCC domain-containing protein [Candidatus Tectomicrobia bacterium]
MPASPAGIHLRLTRTFEAPREKVFRAWTDPEALKRWWGPADFDCIEAQSDPRPGGRYRITVREREKGEVYTVLGEYREVEPPARLVYTWRWGHWDAAAEESLVTVEFHARGASTELTLVHERFPDEGTRDQHSQGWASTLGCLAEYLGG